MIPIEPFTVLAHMGGNDWFIELGLPLVVLVGLYFWSQRGDRAKRGAAEARKAAGDTAYFDALPDKDLVNLVDALQQQTDRDANDDTLLAGVRAELARRGVRRA